MRGSVRSYVTKQGRRWMIVYDSAPDAETGRRRQQLRRGFTSKRGADRALREALASVDAGTHVGRDTRTMGEYLRTWLAGLAVRPATLALYRQCVELHLVPTTAKDGRRRPGIGGIRLQALTPEHLDALYRWLQHEGRQDGGPLAPKTVRHVHTTVRRALQDAVERGYVLRNAADLAHPPTQRQARSRAVDDNVWTAEELRFFLAATRQERLYAAFHLLATTGLRRGELLALRWSDVDLQARSLRVRRTLTQVDGRLVWQDGAKTDAGERVVALDDRAAEVVREHRRRQLEERTLLGLPPDDSGLVFADLEGRPIKPDAVLRRFQLLAAKAGMPRITLHGLRHSYATAALRAGVPVEVLSKRLGHADIAVTLAIYRKVDATDDRLAADRAAAAILGSDA